MNNIFGKYCFVPVLIATIVLPYSCARETEMEKAARELNIQGLELFSKRNFQMAIALFSKAYKKNPNEAEYPNNIGTCYLSLNQFNDAKKYYKLAVKINPNHALYHYNLGFVYSQTREENKAINEFIKAVSVNKNYFPAWSKLGMLYFQRKEYEKAEGAWITASGIKDDPEVGNSLGMLYMNKNDLTAARVQFKKSIKINEDFYLSHYNLGVLYQKEKDYKNAVLSYSKTIQLNPQGYMAHYNKAIVLTHLNKKKEAVKSLKDFLKYCPPEQAKPIADAKKRISDLIK